LPVDEVTRSLEERFQTERAGVPFFGQTKERIQAEEFATVWTKTDHYKRGILVAARCLNPLRDHTGLFRNFASIAPSPEGILAFANQYGNLILNCPILAWQEESLAMQRAVRVWDLLRPDDFTTLKHYFQWQQVTGEWYEQLPMQQARSVFYEFCLYKRILILDSHPEAVAVRPPRYPIRRAKEPIAWRWLPLKKSDAMIEKIDAAVAAKAYLQQVINDRSEKHVESRLVWSEAKTLVRILVPRSLLGAIWLQFEKSIMGNKEYRACGGPGCSKVFEIAPGINRTDKHYCSDLCRVKAHQLRKRNRDR
jgi:hypothetical protein